MSMTKITKPAINDSIQTTSANGEQTLQKSPGRSVPDPRPVLQGGKAVSPAAQTAKSSSNQLPADVCSTQLAGGPGGVTPFSNYDASAVLYVTQLTGYTDPVSGQLTAIEWFDSGSNQYGPYGLTTAPNLSPCNVSQYDFAADERLTSCQIFTGVTTIWTGTPLVCLGLTLTTTYDSTFSVGLTGSGSYSNLMITNDITTGTEVSGTISSSQLLGFAGQAGNSVDCLQMIVNSGIASVAVGPFTYSSVTPSAPGTLNVDSIELTNNTSAPQVITETRSYQIGSTNSWTATNTVTGSLKTTLSTGIPFVANGAVEISLQDSFAYNWGESQTNTETSSVQVNCSVPGNSSVTASVTASSYSLTLNYTALMTLTRVTGVETQSSISGTFNGAGSSSLDVIYSTPVAAQASSAAGSNT